MKESSFRISNEVIKTAPELVVNIMSGMIITSAIRKEDCIEYEAMGDMFVSEAMHVIRLNALNNRVEWCEAEEIFDSIISMKLLDEIIVSYIRCRGEKGLTESEYSRSRFAFIINAPAACRAMKRLVSMGTLELFNEHEGNKGRPRYAYRMA